MFQNGAVYTHDASSFKVGMPCCQSAATNSVAAADVLSASPRSASATMPAPPSAIDS